MLTSSNPRLLPRLVVLVALSAVIPATLVGCPSSNACTPGRIETCPCPGGGEGIQTCEDRGTFGPCECGGGDAGVDAPELDAPVPDDVLIADALDATVEDAGDSGESDGGPGPDAPDAAVDVPGHGVLIGNCPPFGDDALDTMIANAVYLSERPGTVDVLEYVENSAGLPCVERVHDVIEAAAAPRGRTVAFTSLTSAFGLAAALPATDVLLVYPQLVKSDVLRVVADGWRDSVTAFLDAGGVVVVLASSTRGSGGSDGAEALVLSGPGLFSLFYPFFSDSSRPAMEIVAPADPIAAGVFSPFPSTANPICFNPSSGGTLVARTVAPGLCPFARHLVR